MSLATRTGRRFLGWDSLFGSAPPTLRLQSESHAKSEAARVHALAEMRQAAAADQLTASRDEHRQTVARLEKELEEARSHARSDAQSLESRALRAEAALSEERASTVRQQQASGEELSAARHRVQELAGEVHRLQSHVEWLAEQAEQYRRDAAVAEETAQCAERGQSLAEQRLAAAHEDISRLQSQLKESHSEAETAQHALAELRQVHSRETRTAVSERQRLEADVSSLRRQVETLTGKLSDATMRQEVHETSLAEAREALRAQAADEQRKQAELEAQTLREELEMLRNIGAFEIVGSKPSHF